jgi:hypothetical protein
MGEKQFKYAAAIKQPQTVGAVKLDPKGGILTEREYKAVKKDAYGASLLEKGLISVIALSEQESTEDGSATASSSDSSPSGNENGSEDIPDFDKKGD